MRWLIGLFVFVGLAIAGDAALRSFVEGKIEERLASELGDSSQPEVSLGGFPFVMKLLGGRVPEAKLEATDARRAGLTIEKLTLELKGVTISLNTASTSGSASARVERGDGSATVTLDVLSDYIERQTPLNVIGFDGDEITIAFRGRRVTVPLRLEDGSIALPLPRADDLAVPMPRVLRGVDYRTIELREDVAVLTFELHNASLRSI